MQNEKKKPSPYGSIKFATVDEYHNTFSGDVRERLNQLRNALKSVLPKAEEVISYNMPAFREKKILVYYAAAKAHIGFYPTPSPIHIFAEQLKPYKTTKGAIQFPLSEPLPIGLIQAIALHRRKEVEDAF